MVCRAENGGLLKMASLKKIAGSVLAAGLAVAALSGAARAEDKFGYTWTITGASDYMFRGISYTSSDPTVNSYLEGTYGIFYLGLWTSNIDTCDGEGCGTSSGTCTGSSYFDRASRGMNEGECNYCGADKGDCTMYCKCATSCESKGARNNKCNDKNVAKPEVLDDGDHQHRRNKCCRQSTYGDRPHCPRSVIGK